jgi:hypothetical protein
MVAVFCFGSARLVFVCGAAAAAAAGQEGVRLDCKEEEIGGLATTTFMFYFCNPAKVGSQRL